MNAVKEMEHLGGDRSRPNMDFLRHFPTIRNTIMFDPMGIGMLTLMALDSIGKDVEKTFNQ